MGNLPPKDSLINHINRHWKDIRKECTFIDNRHIMVKSRNIECLYYLDENNYIRHEIKKILGFTNKEYPELWHLAYYMFNDTDNKLKPEKVHENCTDFFPNFFKADAEFEQDYKKIEQLINSADMLGATFKLSRRRSNDMHRDPCIVMELKKVRIFGKEYEVNISNPTIKQKTFVIPNTHYRIADLNMEIYDAVTTAKNYISYTAQNDDLPPAYSVDSDQAKN